jgi:erythromycin esterase-like protein
MLRAMAADECQQTPIEESSSVFLIRVYPRSSVANLPFSATYLSSSSPVKIGEPVHTLSHCCPKQDRMVMWAVENEGFGS